MKLVCIKLKLMVRVSRSICIFITVTVVLPKLIKIGAEFMSKARLKRRIDKHPQALTEEQKLAIAARSSAIGHHENSP
jgi:hypothetical protein